MGFKRLASGHLPEIAWLEASIGRSRPGAAPPVRVVGVSKASRILVIGLIKKIISTGPTLGLKSS